jgi:Short-chain dehydrogenases of various substrate specificities
MENRESVVFVTGASSGIGNACATFLAKKGNKVYGSCRSPSSYSRKADEFFDLVQMDQRDQASVTKAAEKVFAAESRVDVLIACAGSGLAGAVEETSLEEAQALMEANLFGTLRVIKAFLPKMREAGKGKIIVVGGLEGLVPAPYQGIYSASQAALDSLVLSLRLELADLGLQIGMLDLGSFRTAFGQRRIVAQAAASVASPYRKSFDNVLGVLERDEAIGLEPLLAVREIQQMLAARRLPARVVASRLPRRILALSRAWLPSGLIEWRLRRYYKLG